MERLSVHQKHTKHTRVTKKKPLKVVYISSPMKFTASADQFRAIVQELTGMNSNIASFADHATGLLTADLPNNPKLQTTVDNTCEQVGSEQFNFASNGYFNDVLATEIDLFGDLSEICYESMRCTTNDCVRGGLV